MNGLFAEIAGGVSGCCYSRSFEEFKQTNPAASAFLAELIAGVLIVDGAKYVGEEFGVSLFDGVFIDEVAAGVCGASGVIVRREAVGDIVIEFHYGWLTEGPFGQETMTVPIHVIGGGCTLSGPPAARSTPFSQAWRSGRRALADGRAALVVQREYGPTPRTPS